MTGIRPDRPGQLQAPEPRNQYGLEGLLCHV